MRASRPCPSLPCPRQYCRRHSQECQRIGKKPEPPLHPVAAAHARYCPHKACQERWEDYPDCQVFSQCLYAGQLGYALKKEIYPHDRNKQLAEVTNGEPNLVANRCAVPEVSQSYRSQSRNDEYWPNSPRSQ